MKAAKKPPPDDEVNMRGRILALRAAVRRGARADALAGSDYMRALGRRTKAMEPRMKRLRARLAKVLRQGAPKSETSRTSRRPPGKRKRKRADDQGDILETLGAL